MKNIKDKFYLFSAWASGTCLVLMVLLILAQIVARLIGEIIPSSEDFAGWILSATIFFGLAYTFHEGGHIRVTIMLNRCSAKKQLFFEYINIVVGLAISGFLAYYTIVTVYDSFDYHEVTDTYLAVPLWMVQTPMAIGSLFLFIALIDAFVDMLTGKVPNYVHREGELEAETATEEKATKTEAEV
jgi:TRAP-type C4-dicarboxylate transport system permease small subunit